MTPDPQSNSPPAREPAALDARLLHTIPQAAALLSVSERTIKRLIEDGELRPVHIRTATRIPQWELERYARAEWAIENGLTETPQPSSRVRRRSPPRRIVVVPRRD